MAGCIPLLGAPAFVDEVVAVIDEQLQLAQPSLTRTEEDGKGASVSITFRDARKGTIVMDVTDQEAEEMGRKGRKQARRGRRPKA